MANEMLKGDIIYGVKNILSQIPFNTIYSYADTIFDLKAVRFNDNSILAQAEFLKNTKLSDLEYSNTHQPFFTMTNRSTGESIEVSNRNSSRQEIRGKNLRDLLDLRKAQAPNELACDTITKILRSPEYSDAIASFKYALADKPISEEHFDLFIATLLGKIQEKIKAKVIKNDLDPLDIRDKDDLQDKIWEGIDVESIYDATAAFAAHLQQIKDKGEGLTRRGYPAAAQDAANLYRDLNAAKDELMKGNLTVKEFGGRCDQLVEDAEESELQNHRGFFGNIWHGIKIALNVITFGAVSVTPTAAIEQTTALKKSLSKFMESKGPSEVSEVSEVPEGSVKSQYRT